MDWKAYAQDRSLKQIDIGTNLLVPAVRARRATNQSITSATWTVLNFDAEDYDTDGMHDLLAQTNRLTVRTPGKYTWACNIAWPSNTTGFRAFLVLKNSESISPPSDTGVIIGGGTVPAPSTGVSLYHGSAGEVDLAVGDFLTVIVFQNSGGGLNLNMDTHLEAVWNGPGLVSSGGRPYVVTSLPTGAIHGDEVYYQPDPASNPQILWHLRYDAKVASSLKWQFLGGSPIRAFIATDEGTSSGSFTNLATTGPSITLPLEGDYYISHGAILMGNNNALTHALMSYAMGGTAAADAEAVESVFGTALHRETAMTKRLLTGFGAQTAIVAKYRSGTSNSVNFKNRWIEAVPQRVI